MIDKEVLKPLLVRFEEEIEEPITEINVSYDKDRMIMVVGDKPLAHLQEFDLKGVTKHTRVSQETTDDD